MVHDRTAGQQSLYIQKIADEDENIRRRKFVMYSVSPSPCTTPPQNTHSGRLILRSDRPSHCSSILSGSRWSSQNAIEFSCRSQASEPTRSWPFGRHSRTVGSEVGPRIP